MTNVPLTEKQRREQRLRSSSFLKSLGVERTTAFMVVAISVLLFVFFSILGSEIPDAPSAESESAADATIIADPDEVPVLPGKPVLPNHQSSSSPGY